MSTQYFEASILKTQADGDIALSNYVEDGESLVESSFASKQPVEEGPSYEVVFYTDLEFTDTDVTTATAILFSQSGAELVDKNLRFPEVTLGGVDHAVSFLGIFIDYLAPGYRLRVPFREIITDPDGEFIVTVQDGSDPGTVYRFEPAPQVT